MLLKNNRELIKDRLENLLKLAKENNQEWKIKQLENKLLWLNKKRFYETSVNYWDSLKNGTYRVLIEEKEVENG